MSEPIFDLVCFGQVSLDTIRDGQRVTSNLLGGAALYTAAIASTLGLRVGLTTRIGSDCAEEFTTFLLKSNIDRQGVKVNDGKTTRLILHYSGQEFRSIEIDEGVGKSLTVSDIPEAYYNASFAYVAPAPYEAQLATARAMKEHGVRVCFDPHADFNRRPFQEIARILKFVDLFFANESEILAITRERNLEKAIERLGNTGVSTIVATRGAQGSIIAQGNNRYSIPAFPPNHLVDVVGAGDAYKAGYLYAYLHGKSPRDCGRLGAATASYILQSPGMTNIPTFEQARQLYMRHPRQRNYTPRTGKRGNTRNFVKPS